jgi:predicted transcriptional regulator
MIEEVFKEIDEIEKEMFRPLSMPEEDIFQIFTQKRIEMLKKIKEETVNSIRELASTLERDVKNVWDDLEILEKNNLIYLRKQGRRKIPVMKKRCIIFMFK